MLASWSWGGTRLPAGQQHCPIARCPLPISSAAADWTHPTPGAPAPCSCDDIEKEACFILGLLAVKPEYQTAIATQGALPGLVNLLVKHKVSCCLPRRCCRRQASP